MEEMDLYEHGETVQAFIRQVDVTEKHHLRIQYYYCVGEEEYVNDKIFPDLKYRLNTALNLQKEFSKDTVIAIHINPLKPCDALYVLTNEKPSLPYSLWIGILLLWLVWFCMYSGQVFRWKK